MNALGEGIYHSTSDSPKVTLLRLKTSRFRLLIDGTDSISFFIFNNEIEYFTLPQFALTISSSL